jgi:hypothetical protein
VEEEFEVPSAHEHAVEHAAGHHHPLGQQVALFSAMLATLGAIVSFLGGHTQNEALYYKNEAVLMKARASDLWAYYQAEELKEHLAKQAAMGSPTQAVAERAEATHYATKAAEISGRARELDRKSDNANLESERALAPHTKLAFSMTLLQIAIALASVTALTGRRWLLMAAGGFALFGIVLGALAWF